ncbi:hypothetical protein [Bacteroides uniformis]|uniref:Uncharacterized protein n=1 Tax=Bacteroides uniformis TaxID=820 RepID=A0A6I0LPW9_BACUN|nr:hypothetical protein [Bacteroides uniformis]KAB4246624.1 hypothetical protein GAP49_18200 [Bacteroides uniformis]KAB4248362.1 hypothetical protein GAP48_18600 [Bacteroides uniformis]KAB4252383.1 hypothetical protein GAO04_09845 [Bacteroides uniformis]KAB4261333.1 hypothetical protein GAP40_09135 [Bacteroides uniformis]
MRAKTIKGTSMPKSELNAYSVGIMRLNETHIANENFNRDDIEFIGRCSISRREVIIGKIGNFWYIRGRSLDVELKVQAQYGKDARFKAYYIVKGKRVTVLHPSNNGNMSEFECRDTSKPVYMMNAEEIFYAAKGKRPSRKCGAKISFSTKLANGAKMEKR